MPDKPKFYAVWVKERECKVHEAYPGIDSLSRARQQAKWLLDQDTHKQIEFVKIQTFTLTNTQTIRPKY